MSYDGRRSADIYLSYSFWNGVCGLCGTFDGNEDNDMQLPNGELVSISRAWAYSTVTVEP